MYHFVCIWPGGRLKNNFTDTVSRLADGLFCFCRSFKSSSKMLSLFYEQLKTPHSSFRHTASIDCENADNPGLNIHRIQNITPLQWQPAKGFVAPLSVVKSIVEWLGRLSSATSAQPPAGRGSRWRLIALTWGAAIGCWFRIWGEKWLKKYCTTEPIDSEVWALLILCAGLIAQVPLLLCLLRLLFLFLAPFCDVCFSLLDTVHSGATDRQQHQSCRLPAPLGLQARRLREKICPAASWGQPLTALSWH